MIADSEHVDRLRQGPRPWNAWRAENPRIAPNLIGISLGIGDRQMGPINGGPINLAYAKLRDASLRFATLTAANLCGAELANADLRDARLEGADLTGADLSGALLDRADLSDVSLAGANLCGVSLVEVRNLTTAQLHEAEGDANTTLPAHIERPLIWTAATAVDHRPQVSVAESRPAARPSPDPEPVALHKSSEPLEDVSQTPHVTSEHVTSKHVTWLVGGPRNTGR